MGLCPPRKCTKTFGTLVFHILPRSRGQMHNCIFREEQPRKLKIFFSKYTQFLSLKKCSRRNTLAYIWGLAYIGKGAFTHVVKCRNSRLNFVQTTQTRVFNPYEKYLGVDFQILYKQINVSKRPSDKLIYFLASFQASC